MEQDLEQGFLVGDPDPRMRPGVEVRVLPRCDARYEALLAGLLARSIAVEGHVCIQVRKEK